MPAAGFSSTAISGTPLFLGGRYWAAELARDGRWKELGRALRDHRGQIDWRSDLLEHGLRQLVPARTQADRYAA